MGSVKIANGKINLCAEREMAITFVYNWENRRTVFMCLKGTTSQDMYGSTPVAMYKEPVLRRSAFQAHLSVLVNPDTSCPAGRSKLDVPGRHYATGQCAFPAQFIFPKKLFYINYPRI